MTDRGKTDSLRRALRVFGMIVMPVGIFWVLFAASIGGLTLALVGVIATVFALFLILEARAGDLRSEADLANRVALATQVTATCAVVAEPVIGTALALGSLIPVVLALPYVRRTALSRLMVLSAIVGAACLLAPSIIPWGSHFDATVASFLPTSTLIVVYGLFELFLWNASTRLTDTTSGAAPRHRDVARPRRDPGPEGRRPPPRAAYRPRLARRRLRPVDLGSWRATGSSPSGSTRKTAPWTSSRRMTSPDSRRRATSSDRTSRYIVDIDDPDADPAEAAYLQSIGSKSLVMLPLVVRGESIGIVELSAKRDRRVHRSRRGARPAPGPRGVDTFDNARLYDELRLLAYRDPLTGLANRHRVCRTTSTTRSRGSAAEARTTPRCCSSTWTTSST